METSRRRPWANRVAWLLTRLWIILAVLCIGAGLFAEWMLNRDEQRIAFEASLKPELQQRLFEIDQRKKELEEAIEKTRLPNLSGMVGPFSSIYDAWKGAPDHPNSYHLSRDGRGFWWIPKSPNHDAFYHHAPLEVNGQSIPDSNALDLEKSQAEYDFSTKVARHPFDWSQVRFHADVWSWVLIPTLALYAVGATLFWAARAPWE